ncbi:L-serine ammonia-lyase [Granulicella sibirica]|uniref:L-serine ammonia-lyase n=1 Tax=Granulicella sibirica TaxID=2479048 RepID=A0A4Q0T5Y9_9BACT|nr:L-serine ammonia-lyase [Granulicella sibirica]RXH57429.1 L-serine dehydratase [Granulicella sibirica]
MNTSLFELFKIGIGPSSSHTVGPMRAALRFVRELDEAGQLDATARLRADLYGSLALTGIGHATDRAVLLGLLGEAPDTVDPALVEQHLAGIRAADSLALLGRHPIPFNEPQHLLFHRDQMFPDPGVPTHPNGIRFAAFDAAGARLREDVFFSVGGGFILSRAEFHPEKVATSSRTVPYPFSSAAELLHIASAEGLTIANLLLANEVALLESDAAINRPPPHPEAFNGTAEDRIRASILSLWRVMQQCTERGIATQGILPGGLNVRRRAHRLAERLNNPQAPDPLAAIDWVTLYAMAVNEENAAGGRVVTAPTNGAAGVIPSIAHYYMRFIEGPGQSTQEEKQDGLIRFFLTAAAIGILYKENASISGAEVGCQGEVGVACSMAAGGLVAALNGTNEQVEHAAEIGMEHNLGMTCDPIGGLVQIPCIERNGMGAVKAINAARMAMHETEGHKLSLDQVIATMYQTGLDMQSRYKETSLAGLALNIIEC